jgi:hypothetical protein
MKNNLALRALRPGLRVLRLFLLAALVVGLVLTFRAPAQRVYALPSPTFCYAVADNGTSVAPDSLLRIERDGTADTLIAANVGVTNIEAIAFQPGTDTLYAANGGQLGTLDLVTGAFSAVGGGIGAGNGALGPITFNDIDSLTFDPLTGIMYGTQRREAAAGDPDLLLQINPATGAVIPGVWPGGDDYVVIPNIVAGGITLDDVDDIAIDPWDGQMYAIINEIGGTDDELVILNKATGAIAADIGPFFDGVANVNDMEGLGFFNDGVLYATTGDNGPAATNDRLWQIDKGTGNATLISGFSAGSDFEAIDCLVADVNTITGTVYLDTNENGGLYEPGTDVPEQGVTVRLYRDANGNGQVDGGDILLQTQDTDAAGFYSFTVAATGPFVLDIDPGDLPADNIMTTDNLEDANFVNTGVAFSEFGQTDPDNDFGYRLRAPGGGGGGGGAQDTPTPAPEPTSVPVPEVGPISPPGPEPVSLPTTIPAAAPMGGPGLPKTGAPPGAFGLVRIVTGVLLAIGMITGGVVLLRRRTD